jgi:hypothetical protein
MTEMQLEIHFQQYKFLMDYRKYFFGAEGFSTANLLDQKILTITDNFEINVGINKITLGTHNEFTQSKNVFF